MTEIRANGAISVTVVADSISEQGVRLTTLALKYPRFFHSELNTHRLLAKSAASSRAIPIKKVISQVENTPATPSYWGQNKAGMQASEELSGWRLSVAKRTWRVAGLAAAQCARLLAAVGLHKQSTNRILEPFIPITTLVTATEFDNFFHLRCEAGAQPEFRELANAMYHALRKSKPTLRHVGEWHLPYIRPSELNTHTLEELRQMSSARCARVSYLTHDGSEPNAERDLQLFNKLITSKPVHGSPTEHVATPSPIKTVPNSVELDALPEGISHVTRDGRVWSGSAHGWIQFRKLIPDEQFTGRFELSSNDD